MSSVVRIDNSPMRAIMKAIGPIIIAGILLLTIINVFWGPNPRVHQLALEKELQMLHAPPDAKVVSFDGKPQRGRVLLNVDYDSQLAYENLKLFYASQLQRNGWTVVKEKTFTDLGQDTGGRAIYFCKGPYQAALQYAGERAKYGWTYAISMSWRIGSYCE